MPVPATTGQLRTRIQDMKIGDYIQISFHKTDNNTYKLANISSEYPITGVAFASLYDGFFYGVKVAKGLIVADRVKIHTVSWDALNSWKNIEGTPINLNGNQVILRSLTGGCAYADENGNMSLTDKGFGAFPTNNEWDKYIVNFPTDKIQAGKTLDDVFHHSEGATVPATWVQETPVNNTVYGANATSSYRAYRGRNGLSAYGHTTSNTALTSLGFRPVFQYDESEL